MEMTIDEFIDKFNESREYLDSLKENCFNEETGKYYIFGVEVYTDKNNPSYFEVWFLDYNDNICYNKTENFWD